MNISASIVGSLSAASVGRSMSAEPDLWQIYLGEFVDEFRRRTDSQLVIEAPPSGMPRRLRALLASVVEALCAEKGLASPAWCEEVGPMPEPWFVAGMESLKASALVESPVFFRKRNIFVLGNFLSRV